MRTRTLPPYLRVVPQPGKPFRRPRKAAKPKVPLPLTRDSKEVDDVICNAELVAGMVARLHRAIRERDWIAVEAMSATVNVEARSAAALARGLKGEGTRCA